MRAASSKMDARREMRGVTTLLAQRRHRSALGVRAAWSRVASCAALLLVTLASSGCTLLYIFNSDPEGLPCDFSTDIDGDGEVTAADGRCLQDFEGVDYTCIEGVCRKARVLQAGEPCSSTDQ
jgi:hypothetical protein